jgi:hypothetical protein
MTDEQKAKIKEYVKKLNDAASLPGNADILDFSVDEVADRVLLYLNREDLPVNIERIVARIISGIFNQSVNAKPSTSADSAISSMSDNGQSISFSNEVKNYLATVDDNELFAGSSKLLAPYRRINVVAE